MIDYKILAAFGTTNERLKEVFTAVPDPDLAPRRGESKQEKQVRLQRKRKNAADLNVRERFRRKIQTRVEEGIVTSLRNWRKYASVDMAWDTNVISSMTLPLMMYAQGKINVERASNMLNNIDGGQRYLKEDDKGAVDVDIPRFVETNVNLIRSIISRRHSAQVNKFNQLWPYYKYEPRSTGLPAKCRADVLSQRVDMMVDQFGTRHHDGQVMRDGFLYGHCVDFARTSWEVEKQYELKDVSHPATGDNIEAVITKEGVGFFNPLPSRVFWDNAADGLSSINHDDMSWIGFWDVCRFSEIDDNPHYFNKTSVGWTGRFWGDAGIYNSYKDYFTTYNYTIIPPATGEIDPSRGNERKAVVGYYSGNQRDASVFVSNYYEKIVPKDWGIGEYPWPVWIRFVTASDSTVIFAEIMPSTPAAVLSINESDARMVNVSMAMDLFAYQDQMTNLTTHLMLLCQIEAFKAIGINRDLFTAEQVKEIRKVLKGRNWFGDPMVFEYSLLKLQELGIKPEAAINVVQANTAGTIDSVFSAMLKLVEMVEKLLAMSPAEQGQPAPREISATEVNEISTTTSSIYSFISEAIDEFRAAKKRIIYESLVACSSGQIVCPVKDRYTEKTITAAGFKIKAGEDEDYTQTASTRGPTPKRYTVIGSVRSLNHDYIFTTRDGSERPVNTQAANTLVQLVGLVMSNMPIAQALGKEKLYELFNEIFRMSGAGVDLNLTLKEGEDDSLGQDDIDQLKQTLQKVMQSLQRMSQQMQKNAEDITQIEQTEATLQDAIKGLSGLADRVKGIANDVAELHAAQSTTPHKLIESMSYKDAPESIKRQIEVQAGFQPAMEENNNTNGTNNGRQSKPKPRPAETT